MYPQTGTTNYVIGNVKKCHLEYCDWHLRIKRIKELGEQRGEQGATRPDKRIKGDPS